MKKLIVFDLDGTLAESKASLDAEMAKLLTALLGIVKVAVISGGDWLRWTQKTGPQVKMDFCWSAGEKKADYESKTQTA